MPLSSARPEEQDRKSGNNIRGLPGRIVLILRRKYSSAAPGANLYPPKIVLLLWIGLLSCTAIGELLPGDSAPLMALSRSHVNDKVLHFTAYAVVALVPAFGLRLSAAVSCIIATELVGIALEFAQLFVHDRSGDPYDVLSNTIGVLAGVILAIIGRSKVIRKGHFLSGE